MPAAELFNLLADSLLQMLGSTALLVLFTLAFLGILLWLAKVPLYFAFLFAIPALFGVAGAGMLGAAWAKGLIVLVIGLLFGFLVIRMYTDTASTW